MNATRESTIRRLGSSATFFLLKNSLASRSSWSSTSPPIVWTFLTTSTLSRSVVSLTQTMFSSNMSRSSAGRSFFLSRSTMSLFFVLRHPDDTVARSVQDPLRRLDRGVLDADDPGDAVDENPEGDFPVAEHDHLVTAAGRAVEFHELLDIDDRDHGAAEVRHPFDVLRGLRQTGHPGHVDDLDEPSESGWSTPPRRD